jgi:hypothetical protein
MMHGNLLRRNSFEHHGFAFFPAVNVMPGTSTTVVTSEGDADSTVHDSSTGRLGVRGQ